jgi:hypothetical protein
VERALTFSASGSGTGNLGTSQVLRFYLQRGAYDFVRAIRKFGQAAELTGQTPFAYDSDNSRVELVGDGPDMVSLTFRNPDASARAEADIGVCQIVAGSIKLSGITFLQSATSTYKGSYVLYLEGNSVELTDCYFQGPVYIKANRITVKRCTFAALGNTGYNLFPSSITGYPLTAQHLYLAARNDLLATVPFWRVEDNLFSVGVSDGTHASLLMDVVNQYSANVMKVAISGNVWSYGSGGAVPAIHVWGPHGLISISDNQFNGARGVVKAGNVTADTVPFDGNYNGCPLQQDQATSQIYALGYISVTRGRNRTSALNVHHNYFDLSQVAVSNSGRFVMWGAFMAVFNYYTVGSTASVVYSNIRFEDNEVQMRSDTAWGSAAANPQIATWGFWLSPTVQDGSSITNLLVDNIQVRNNHFNLGGESTATAGYMWRSIRSMSLAAWPASGGHLTDSTAVIGIQLKNLVVGAVTWSGRWASNVDISGNQISQQAKDGATGPAGYGQVALETAGTPAHPNWRSYLISLDAGHISTNGLAAPATADETTAPYHVTGLVAAATVPSSGGVFFSPSVSGNRIEAPFYLTTTASPATPPVAIEVTGAYQPSIRGNRIYLYQESDYGLYCISVLGCKRGFVSENIATGLLAVMGPALNYASQNVRIADNAVLGGIVVADTSNNFP